MKNSLLWIVFLCGNESSLSGCFKICSLSFVFRSLCYVIMWVSLVLSYLEFSWLLKSRFMSFTKFGEAFSYIYSNIFLPQTLSPISGSLILKLGLLFLSHRSLWLCSVIYFFMFIFSLFSDEVNFGDLSSKFTSSALFHLYSTTKPIQQVLKKFWLLCFSIVISTLIFFCNFCVFAEIFYLFTWYKKIYDCLLKHVYDGCFKILVW